MDNHQVVVRLQERFPDGVAETQTTYGDLHVWISKDVLVDMLTFLHDEKELQYHLLSDIVGVDRMPETPRFEIIYNLFSLEGCRRLLVHLPVGAGEQVPTVTGIWKAADWPEREVYDLLGVVFSGHPDLRRILTWDNFEGHPLRKDFPLMGKDADVPFDPETVEIN